MLLAAYYIGASFVTRYPVLRWESGREDRPEVRQPVVTGFGSGETWPCWRWPRPRCRRGVPARRCGRGAKRSGWGGGGAVGATVNVPGLAFEAETLWYDPKRWPAWVDGFGHMFKLEGEWPAQGARAVWDSRPGGRGRVVERVTAYEARSGQTLAVEDEKLSGHADGDVRAGGRTALRSRSSSTTRSSRAKRLRPR